MRSAALCARRACRRGSLQPVSARSSTIVSHGSSQASSRAICSSACAPGAGGKASCSRSRRRPLGGAVGASATARPAAARHRHRASRQRPLRMSSCVRRRISTRRHATQQVELQRGGVAEVDDTVFVKGPTVVDAHHQFAPVGRVAHQRPAGQRHRAVRGAEGIHVVGLAAGRGPAVELAPVPRGQPALGHRQVRRHRRVAAAQHLVGLVGPAARIGSTRGPARGATSDRAAAATAAVALLSMTPGGVLQAASRLGTHAAACGGARGRRGREAASGRLALAQTSPSLASASTISWLNCWNNASTLPLPGVVVVEPDHTSVKSAVSNRRVSAATCCVV